MQKEFFRQINAFSRRKQEAQHHKLNRFRASRTGIGCMNSTRCSLAQTGLFMAFLLDLNIIL